MVSDIHEFSIPEVRLFFRFCEHSDSDVLPIGTQLTSAHLFTLVQFVWYLVKLLPTNYGDKTDLLSGELQANAPATDVKDFWCFKM